MFRAWPYVQWRRRSSALLYRLSGTNLTWGGQWGEEEQHNIGEIVWQTTSGWGRRRRRRYAARVTTTTTLTMATGEEEMEGGVDVEREREGRRGRGLFRSPHNSKLVSSFIVTILTLHLFLACI